MKEISEYAQLPAGTGRCNEMKAIPNPATAQFHLAAVQDFWFHSGWQCTEEAFAVALGNYAGVADDYAAAFCR